MKENTTPNMETKINNNTSVSIGLAIIVISAIFWGGVSLGKVQGELQDHSTKMEKMMPRKEAESQYTNLNDRLKEMQQTQKEILFQLKKEK